jgi:hypothetical protein
MGTLLFLYASNARFLGKELLSLKRAQIFGSKGVISDHAYSPGYHVHDAYMIFLIRIKGATRDSGCGGRN